MLNARLRRGGVNNSRFRGVKDWFLHSEDTVAAAGGGRQWVKTMVAYSLDQVTTAMPLPDTSGERSRRRALTRRLREVMYDALPRELPELAVPAPGAQLLAVVFLQLREPLSLIHRWL